MQLTKEDFDKLLGPLTEILERNAEEYVKPVNERNLLGDDASKICSLEELQNNTIGLLGNIREFNKDFNFLKNLI